MRSAPNAPAGPSTVRPNLEGAHMPLDYIQNTDIDDDPTHFTGHAHLVAILVDSNVAMDWAIVPNTDGARATRPNLYRWSAGLYQNEHPTYFLAILDQDHELPRGINLAHHTYIAMEDSSSYGYFSNTMSPYERQEWRWDVILDYRTDHLTPTKPDYQVISPKGIV